MLRSLDKSERNFYIGGRNVWSFSYITDNSITWKLLIDDIANYLLYKRSFLMSFVLIFWVYLYLYTEKNVFYGKRND